MTGAEALLAIVMGFALGAAMWAVLPAAGDGARCRTCDRSLPPGDEDQCAACFEAVQW